MHDPQNLGVAQSSCEGLCARGLEQAICLLLVMGMKCSFVSPSPDGSVAVSITGKEDLTRQALEDTADDLEVRMVLQGCPKPSCKLLCKTTQSRSLSRSLEIFDKTSKCL